MCVYIYIYIYTYVYMHIHTPVPFRPFCPFPSAVLGFGEVDDGRHDAVRPPVQVS